MLHEIASGSMDYTLHQVDYLAQRANTISTTASDMNRVDRSQQRVHVDAHLDAEGQEVTPARSFPYDTLVIAIGSAPS
ncbi:MAG: hypothetical protein R3E89_15205 [Thiolinea sp.]